VNLNREGRMRSSQWQLGTWESSQRLLRDRGKRIQPEEVSFVFPTRQDTGYVLHGY
jgi:hypothetical protein